jgi:hypothetical protein
LKENKYEKSGNLRSGFIPAGSELLGGIACAVNWQQRQSGLE